jgi:hypothetical protein
MAMGLQSQSLTHSMRPPPARVERPRPPEVRPCSVQPARQCRSVGAPARVAGLGIAARAPAVGDYGHQLGRVQALDDVA